MIDCVAVARENVRVDVKISTPEEFAQTYYPRPSLCAKGHGAQAPEFEKAGFGVIPDDRTQ